MTIEIMMPFYGRFDHFRAAVESVLAQSDEDWTLTVIDDVYPDTAPGEWLQAIGDQRIEYRRNETNLGVSGNFIECVRLARTENVVIFGCDDIMLDGYVARVRELLAAYEGIAMISPCVEVIDEDGVVTRTLVDRTKARFRFSVNGPEVFGGEELAASLLKGNWAYFPSVVWRVDLLRRYGFNPRLDVVQDLNMMLDIIADGGKMVIDDDVVFQYRRHAASVSSWMATDGSRFEQERELFAEQVRRFRERGWSRAARVASWHMVSRLNALTRIPDALRAKDGHGMRQLIGHAFAAPLRGAR